MTSPIHTQEETNNPYADWGYDGDEDFGSNDGMTFSATPEVQEPSKPQLTTEGEGRRIAQIQSKVDLAPSAKKDLDDLQRKLNYVYSLSGDAQKTSLADIDATLNQLEHPSKNQSTAQTIGSFLKEHAKTISDEDKKKWEKLATELELHPDELKVIGDEFKKFQSATIQASLYSPAIQQVSKQTGVSMEKIQAAADKLGIKDLSKLTTQQAIQLLPQVGGSAVQKDIAAVKDVFSKLQAAIDSNTKSINAANDRNRGKSFDKMKIDSTPFQAMLDISNGKDKNSLALRDAIDKLNKDSGPVLAVMLGKAANQVSYIPGKTSDPNVASANRMASRFGVSLPTQPSTMGMISIGGENFSILSNLRTGEVGYNKQALALPEIKLPPIFLGENSQDSVFHSSLTPDWVNSESYPVE